MKEKEKERRKKESVRNIHALYKSSLRTECSPKLQNFKNITIQFSANGATCLHSLTAAMLSGVISSGREGKLDIEGGPRQTSLSAGPQNWHYVPSLG